MKQFKTFKNKSAVQRWDDVVWTQFTPVPVDPYVGHVLGGREPDAIFVNSRYQVSMWLGVSELFGKFRHLSIKTHDREARHDWRDMQRIKNELVGPECEAIEIFPAESRLVDGANQYHLFVFESFKIPLGFSTRLVSDGAYTVDGGKPSKQRAWAPGERPADCLDQQQFDEYVKAMKSQGS